MNGAIDSPLLKNTRELSTKEKEQITDNLGELIYVLLTIASYANLIISSRPDKFLGLPTSTHG
jgi:hypothetical protein